MAMVGAACGLAAVGLAKNAEWGRRLAIGVLTVNLIGDSLNAVLRHDPRTLIGLPIGGLMIWYLISRRGDFLTSPVRRWALSVRRFLLCLTRGLPSSPAG